MTTNQQNVQAVKINTDFNNAYKKFVQLLVKQNQQDSILKPLSAKMKAYREESFISVVFVGQYSAGKSTIISALTGKRNIKIDADIATDKTTSYNWNGINLIDTPGLFTERKDHDSITYNAISKADLLVFCLTSMLFDSITIENFKKLAYEKGYQWKMMLVVNKMSDEAGEDDEKINNYRHSLAEAIKPYPLDQLPLCFIDAKDYCEGIDENEDFLVEISRFQTFIDTLNQFVAERHFLARLDTPVRIVLESIDEAEIAFSRNKSEDTTILEVFRKLSRTINSERNSLRTKINNIALDLYSSITNEGSILASALDSSNFDFLNKQAENKVHIHYENAILNMEKIVEEAVNSMQTEIEGILSGDLVQAFIKRLNFQYEASLNHNSELEIAKIKNQINFLTELGNKVGFDIMRLATKEGVNQVGFLKSINVSGSPLRNIVYDVGKFVGYKFRPWEAVNIAKNFANGVQIVGGILGVVGVVAEIWQQEEQENKLSEARMSINSQFIGIASNLRNQITEQITDIENKLYSDLEKEIAEIRKKYQTSINTSDTSVKELSEIRHDLDEILRSINRASIS